MQNDPGSPHVVFLTGENLTDALQHTRYISHETKWQGEANKGERTREQLFTSFSYSEKEKENASMFS